LTVIFSGAVFLAVSQSILTNGLVNDLSQKIPNVDPNAIIAAGATGIRNLFSQDLLPLVLESYNLAVRHVFIMGVVLGVCSTIASFFFEWKNIKGENTINDVA